MKKGTLFIACLIGVYFFNRWLPASQSLFNIVSISLNVPNVDFYAYYLGGQAYGQGLEPYSAYADVQKYIYPPTFLPLYGLLARLDYNTARMAWVGVYALLFLCAAGFLLGVTPAGERLTAALLLAGLALVSYPLAYLIRQGQVDLVGSSLAFISLLFYVRKRPSVSAGFLAAATLVKFNPLMLLVTFVLFTWDWKYLLRYAAALAGMVLLSLLFIPPAWYAIFLTQVLPQLTGSLVHIYNQTPLRFFAGHALAPRLITLGGAAVLSAFALWSGRRIREKQPHHIFAFYLLNVAGMLLLSGSAWIMAYTWFLLPVVPLLLGAMRREGRLFLAALCLAALLTQCEPHAGPFFFSDIINMTGAAGCALCMGWVLLREAGLLHVANVEMTPPPGRA